MSDEVNTTDNGDPFRGSGSHIRHLISELIPILLATALKILDVAEGRNRLVELIASAFKAKFGAAMRRLELQIEAARTETDIVAAAIHSIRDDLAATPQWLPASKINHGRSADEHVETPVSDWQLRHRFEALLMVLLLPLAATASLLTAKANLEGTGLEIFLSGPLV